MYVRYGVREFFKPDPTLPGGLQPAAPFLQPAAPSRAADQGSSSNKVFAAQESRAGMKGFFKKVSKMAINGHFWNFWGWFTSKSWLRKCNTAGFGLFLSVRAPARSSLSAGNPPLLDTPTGGGGSCQHHFSGHHPVSAGWLESSPRGYPQETVIKICDC